MWAFTGWKTTDSDWTEERQSSYCVSKEQIMSAIPCIMICAESLDGLLLATVHV